LDLSRGLRHLFDVVTLDGDLVFLARLDAFHAIEHGDATNVLLAQEITDLHSLAVVLDGDIDGEMGVNALHLVTITVGDALHHVFDVANDSSHGGDVLTAAEPFLHLDSFLSEHFDVQLGMFEGFLKQSALSLDRDDAVVHRRRDVFRDFHLQARVNGLHFFSLVPSPVLLFIILHKTNFKQIETTQL